MALTTTAGGATYRVVNLEVLIEGPSTQFLFESNPAETVFTTTLTTGTYTSFLENWNLERDDGAGNFVPVMATLESNTVNSFTILNGTTTTLSYRFQTDGAIVTIGTGNLDVIVAVDQTTGACTPLGTDCPVGEWCPPTELTGASRACVPAGAVAVGQACANPSDCVVNASCFDLGAGPVCAALCGSNGFGVACTTGGVCASVTSGYGICE
jgi:hypothetical protein